MKAIARRITFAGALAVVIFYAAFPFAWAIVSSLNAGSDLLAPSLSPSHWTLDNYYDLFREQPFLRNILNSMAVAAASTAASLFAAEDGSLNCPTPFVRPSSQVVAIGWARL
jgi:ABC-type glycerol-3-phosphate transport system permease component